MLPAYSCAGIALLLAGVSTVCLCEDESKSTSAAPSAEAQPPTSNEHTAKWRLYTNKAAQLAKEVQSILLGQQHMRTSCMPHMPCIYDVVLKGHHALMHGSQACIGCIINLPWLLLYIFLHVNSRCQDKDTLEASIEACCRESRPQDARVCLLNSHMTRLLYACSIS